MFGGAFAGSSYVSLFVRVFMKFRNPVDMVVDVHPFY
jgi:hypothetical protein